MKSAYIGILLIPLFCFMNIQAEAEEDAVSSLIVESVGLGTKRLAQETSYTAVQKYTKIQIDGDLGEWRDVEPIVLDERTRRTRVIIDGVDPWRGSGDLSARAYLVWDVHNLYFACDVTDDVLHQPPKVSGSLWSGDAIQMAFDPLAGVYFKSQS